MRSFLILLSAGEAPLPRRWPCRKHVLLPKWRCLRAANLMRRWRQKRYNGEKLLFFDVLGRKSTVKIAKWSYYVGWMGTNLWKKNWKSLKIGKKTWKSLKIGRFLAVFANSVAFLGTQTARLKGPGAKPHGILFRGLGRGGNKETHFFGKVRRGLQILI